MNNKSSGREDRGKQGEALWVGSNLNNPVVKNVAMLGGSREVLSWVVFWVLDPIGRGITLQVGAVTAAKKRAKSKNQTFGIG